jgi:hypothetical protein
MRWNRLQEIKRLVEEALAADRPAKTRNPIVTVDLALELVIVRKFFIYSNH